MTEDERPELGMDLSPEEESPYLRRQKRVEVRKRLDHRKLLRWTVPLVALGAMLMLSGVVWGLTRFGLTGSSFVLHATGVEVRGTRFVTRTQVMERFASDIGHSVFAIALETRRTAVEQIPWVERADIARMWPDRIIVTVHERRPVAFTRSTEGARGLMLVDGFGQILERPAQVPFSFPLVDGVTDRDAQEDRHRGMATFSALMQDLDHEGTRYSMDISEVDVSDPEDARVIVVDTGILLHLGSGDFLQRYKLYLAHIQEWKRDHPVIGWIDLRYDKQIIVSPDKPPTSAKGVK